jgi:hypothetical protein
MSGFPILEIPVRPNPKKGGVRPGSSPKHAPSQLRSVQAVKGYHVQRGDEVIGSVADFIMDRKNWAISKLLVKTGSWFSSESLSVPVRKVDQISYASSTILTSLTKKDIAKPTKKTLSLANGVNPRLSD